MSMVNISHKSRKKEEIVIEGWLLKRGEHIKTWRPRYFLLYDDGALLGYKSKPNTDQTLPEPLNDFIVKEAQILYSDSPKPNVFFIRCLQWTTVIERNFCAESAQDRDSWCSAIQQVSAKLREKDERGDEEEVMSIVEEDVRSVAAMNAILAQPVTEENGISAPKPEPKISIADTTAAAIRDNIDIEHFDFLKLLGRGTFGKVLLGKEKRTSRLYAVKIIRKDVIVARAEVAHTISESRVLQRCRHPFLTSLTYSFQTPEYLCFVMEFAIGGDLYYHLNMEVARHRRGFSEGRVRFYSGEILLALGYLHACNIVYRDLKLENVLLDREGHIKIADFGLCKEEISYGDTTKTFCGTPEYIAPEVVSDSDYGRAVDWWSLGVVMYEMMCGRLPFVSQDNSKLFDLIVTGKLRFPDTMSDEAKGLLSSLLVRDPTARLGGGPEDAVEICNHVFFNDVDWTALFKKEIPPPFRPELTSETDTRYFDKEFTTASVKLTPPASTVDWNRASQAHFVDCPFQNLFPTGGSSDSSSDSMEA